MVSSATWILVADAHGARLFSFVDKNGEWKLRETIKADAASLTDETAQLGRKTSEHKGALHGHGETNPKETRERRFAHALVHMIERGQSDGALSRLALVAPPKMLGELRENLGRSLKGLVVAELNKDYTHKDMKELEDLLRDELPPL